MIPLPSEGLRYLRPVAQLGELTEHVVGTAGHFVAAEIEHQDYWGHVVGYWAYGEFAPYYPYHGDCPVLDHVKLQLIIDLWDC